MSEVRVNKLSPRSGTTVTLGDSGDTISIPSGVTLSNSGTIDNLNASNLTSGTVPDGRITGAYTGITNLTMSGDLTVDTDTLKVDSTNNRVGITEASPQTTLHVDGTGALFEGMSIDTNLANVTSSFSRQNTGFNYRTTEGLNVTTNSNASASLNRKSDGRILDFYKNDTRKGQIAIDDNGISISLGGTGTSNTLDDYEEGTWTPTYSQGLTSVTYTAQNGQYTKVGRMVSFAFRLENSAGTTNGTHLYISGLPFTTNSSQPGSGAHWSYQPAGITGDQTISPIIFIPINNTRIQFYNAAGGTFLGNDLVSATNDIYIRGVYFTD